MSSDQHKPDSEEKEGKKKSFYDLSTTAQFHYAPKLFGDYAEHPFHDQEIEALRSHVEQSKNLALDKEKEKKLSTHEGQYLMWVMQSALNLHLSVKGQADPAEQNKLNLCRRRLLEMLRDVLHTVKEYISSILQLAAVTKLGVKDDMIQYDRNRSLKHNKLMKELDILNRSLLWWFGKINPDDLSDVEREMFEKQRERYICEELERIDIHKNGICPQTMNLKDRHQVTVWAQAIYGDLISIENLNSLIDLGDD